MEVDTAMPTRPKVEMIGGFEKWQVEGWLNTLLESFDIRADKKKKSAVRLLAVKKKRYLDLLKLK